MSVSTEDAFVIHDIESLTIIIVIIVIRERVIGRAVLEFLFLAHDFGLSTLEGLSHFGR